jgi:hypothetical protein
MTDPIFPTNEIFTVNLHTLMQKILRLSDIYTKWERQVRHEQKKIQFIIIQQSIMSFKVNLTRIYEFFVIFFHSIRID